MKKTIYAIKNKQDDTWYKTHGKCNEGGCIQFEAAEFPTKTFDTAEEAYEQADFAAFDFPDTGTLYIVKITFDITIVAVRPKY